MVGALPLSGDTNAHGRVDAVTAGRATFLTSAIRPSSVGEANNATTEAEVSQAQ